MTVRTRPVQGVAVPSFLYGTAWKEERTGELVSAALDAGFRGFDTANQPRHYDEEAVGRALGRASEAGGPGRESLFVQTKFTHPAGQDHRIPYDPESPVPRRVEESFRSSLRHLGVERIDGYLLHGPSRRRGLGRADREAWRAMEALHDAGEARLIGVSNVTPGQLRELWDLARVEPAFVQNRCFARTGWDREVRTICAERGIAYQAFSLLTANRPVLRHPRVTGIAERRGWTVPQVVFRFSLEVGMIPLTGTTDPVHMREDLEVLDLRLTESEVRALEGLAA